MQTHSHSNRVCGNMWQHYSEYGSTCFDDSPFTCREFRTCFKNLCFRCQNVSEFAVSRTPAGQFASAEHVISYNIKVPVNRCGHTILVIHPMSINNINKRTCPLILQDWLIVCLWCIFLRDSRSVALSRSMQQCSSSAELVARFCLLRQK